MPISEEIFAAFLKCETKAYLRYSGTLGTQSEFSEWRQHRREEYRESCRKLLCSALHTPSFVGTPDLQSLKDQRYHLVVDYVVSQNGINVRLDALVLNRIKGARLDCPYIPVLFVPSEKLSTYEKLMLAFDAVALSKVYGKMPRAGRIIHGRNHTMTTIALFPLLGKIQRVLTAINDQQTKASPPLLAINKHCAECEFQARCRQIAMQKDDLSLLTTLSAKERKKQNGKGIFTVLQLSYTFRSARRSASTPPKHQPALKALAIRKNQIHILGTPAFSLPRTPVYLDVEGDPDRDFYYLIGLRIVSESQPLRCSYWADTQDDEREMWANCLRDIGELVSPRLIHFGAYETQFLKRMRARYPDVGNASRLDELTSSAQNLLSVIYPHVYFPTYTNGLKDIAAYLGFRWSSDSPSGLAALGWRFQWEASREANLKDRLTVYNAEDCEAAERVAAVLASVSCPESASGNNYSPINADGLKREYPQRFGEVEFVLPEFHQINKAAYWDYQRSRVYVRSNSRLKRQSHKIDHPYSLSEVPANKLVAVEERRPASCPRCNSPLIYRYGKLSQTVYDLRLSPAGVKRWVTRYSFSRFICWCCRATLQLYKRKDRYGVDLRAYLLYQIIDLQIPQNAVAKSVKQLFGLPLSCGSINRLKRTEASRFGRTYRAILERIVTGRLVHADETKVEIDGNDGYVWVFTNLEDVAFLYSESRDARTPQAILSNFSGVLISDFYAAYDSIQCAQQKCLVHLMRDLNEDLCKEPFNEEMKELAQDFAKLVKPMIDTVDRFGLKAHYLRKHKESVNRFYEVLSRRNYKTEVAAGYKKRFERNSGKLFTFLDHDGVPWNNNNAEHAIKAFARLRRCIGGKSSARGIRDYLVLLSISETCKCKGVTFLRFLQSGQVDIDSLMASHRNQPIPS